MPLQTLQQPLQYPTPSSSSSTGSAAIASKERQCRVPGCPILNCTLVTHRNYDPIAYRSQQHWRRSSDAASTAVKDLAISRPGPWSSRVGIDGLPALPIHKNLDPQMRDLFHHFFDAVFEGLAQNFRGPAVVKMSDYKQRMFETALGSEGYCMGLIVHAKAATDIAGNVNSTTPQSLVVYTSAIEAFRKQVIAVQKSPAPFQIELALLALCTLISFDAHHHRDEATMMHWMGLQQLVALRGGLPSVTISLAYVVHMDRMCAQRFNKPPAFINTSTHKVPLPSPLWSWYGSKLLMINLDRLRLIDHEVISYCVDTCSLLSLWEISKQGRPCPVSANTHPQPQAPSPDFLYFCRDRIDEMFPILHARYWNQKVKDKYMLWTTRMLEYPCTWVNYFPGLNSAICDRITKGLQEEDLRMWNGDLHMLIWILFALAVVPNAFGAREWVVQKLREILTAKLGEGVWPVSWRQHELENVRSYVWCDSLYMSRFEDVCNELEKNTVKEVTNPVVNTPEWYADIVERIQNDS